MDKGRLPPVFRDHPEIGIALGAILLAIGVFGFRTEWTQYRQGGLFAAIAFLRVQMRNDAVAAARGE